MKSSLLKLTLVVLASFTFSLQLQINELRRANESSIAVVPAIDTTDGGPFISLDDGLKDYSPALQPNSLERASLPTQVAQSVTPAFAEPVVFIDPDQLTLSYGLDEEARSIGSDFFPDDESAYERDGIEASDIGRYLDPISADL